jgi:hypothetical protein
MNPLDALDKLAGRWLDWRTRRYVEKNAKIEDPQLVKLEVNQGRGFEILLEHPGIAAGC